MHCSTAAKVYFLVVHFAVCASDNEGYDRNLWSTFSPNKLLFPLDERTAQVWLAADTSGQSNARAAALAAPVATACF